MALSSGILDVSRFELACAEASAPGRGISIAEDFCFALSGFAAAGVAVTVIGFAATVAAVAGALGWVG